IEASCVGVERRTREMIQYAARHFLWSVDGKVGTITLNRPELKNALTFDTYAEMRDLFRALSGDPGIKVVVITGAGGNFCSGGDVHEIIAPLTRASHAELRDFAHMCVGVVKAMRA